MSEVLLPKISERHAPIVGPALPKIASHFQRFEIKYHLSPLEAARLENELRSSHMRLDPAVANLDQERYTVSSLYFDSPDLMCWHANEAGLKKRFKLRIRSYDSSSSDPALYFLEIKRKDDAVVTKDRVAIPAERFQEAFERNFDPFSLMSREARSEIIGDPAALEEFIFKMARFSMRPTALIRYRRLPLVGRANEKFRVTIDEKIEASPAESFSRSGGFVPVFRSKSVLEVKFNNALPHWFHRILLRHGLRRGKFSKYFHGVRALKESRLF